MRPKASRSPPAAVALVALGLALIAVLAGCSSSPFFDKALASELEATVQGTQEIRCDHQVRDLWLCTYDPGSGSYAELIVRRGPDDCWTARKSRPFGSPHPYSGRGLSFGRHEVVGGKTFHGCA